MADIITNYGGMLIKALGQTLLLAFYSLCFASILGILFGILSVLKSKVCNIISRIFIDVIRGVPMIVLAFFIYFGIPYAMKNIIHVNFTLTALQAGIISLSLNCGAYMAEIIRAGIQAVDKGQMEASRSLGLSYPRAMFHIVMPQAIKMMIPSIINQFIITLKDTSILSVIGFPELVNSAKNVIAISFKSFQVWLIVAVMYLIVITILSRISKIIEGKLQYETKRHRDEH